MVRTLIQGAIGLAMLGGAAASAVAGSYPHQSPALYRRVHSPCPDGQVMRPTTGGGPRAVWGCVPK